MESGLSAAVGLLRSDGMIAAFSEVEFGSRNPVVLRDIRRPDLQHTKSSGLLCMPPPSCGHGPFPALVVCHGLGGMIKNRELRYATWLAGQGVAVLLVDSYAKRGMANSTDTWRALKVTEGMYLCDAFGALDFLSRHERIDAERIGMMGFSYGAMISVLAAYRQTQEHFAVEKSQQFAGHIAFYGPSVPRFERTESTGAPVLIMNGLLDRNISHKRTRQIAEDLRAGGSRVDLHEMPGAYHQWDGEDETRAFKTPAIQGVKTRVLPEFNARCERWGTKVTGAISRAAVILFSSDPIGYYTLRDDKTRDVSDRLIVEFVETNLKQASRQFSSAAG